MTKARKPLRHGKTFHLGFFTSICQLDFSHNLAAFLDVWLNHQLSPSNWLVGWLIFLSIPILPPRKKVGFRCFMGKLPFALKTSRGTGGPDLLHMPWKWEVTKVWPVKRQKNITNSIFVHPKDMSDTSVYHHTVDGWNPASTSWGW